MRSPTAHKGHCFSLTSDELQRPSDRLSLGGRAAGPMFWRPAAAPIHPSECVVGEGHAGGRGRSGQAAALSRRPARPTRGRPQMAAGAVWRECGPLDTEPDWWRHHPNYGWIYVRYRVAKQVPMQHLMYHQNVENNIILRSVSSL